MNSTAHPTSSSAAFINSAAPALELKEARQARDGLANLLRAEHDAMADFLIALAEFDRRRGWEKLGHASLFAFLHVDLKLPNPSAFWRQSAARAMQRFPGLVEPLRDGRLCCTSTAELAKVLTEENWAEVLPRFFGLSSREAQEVVAELQPRQAPATRMVVTRVEQVAVARSPGNDHLALAATPTLLTPDQPYPDVVPPSQLRAPEVDFGGAARFLARRDDIEHLTADLRRIHVTVNREFVKKLQAARDGLSHAIPGATAEQVLEAALDLLLEKQARARGLVKRPRSVAGPATRTVSPDSMANLTANQAEARADTQVDSQSGSSPQIERGIEHPVELPIESLHRRTGRREAIPAAVKRAVWERDGGRCAWPLDVGGCCGSTNQLQLDHVVPWALGGTPTVAGLRLLCGRPEGSPGFTRSTPVEGGRSASPKLLAI